MGRFVGRVGLGVVLGVLVFAGPAGAEEPDGISIRLLDAPVDRSDDPRARLYVVDHVRPGAVLDRRIEVVNTTDGAVTVELGAGSAAVDDGGFRFDGDDDLASWTTVAPSMLTLPAGASGTAEVHVEVPGNAPDGERYAVVWATLPATSASGVRTVNRVGVRMYLSVGTGAEPATDFDVSTLTPRRDEDGRPVVDAEVVNTGGRALDLSGELTLADGPGGTSAGPFAADGGTTVAVGGRGSVTVPLAADLPDGPWRAHLAVRSGNEVRTVEATLTFPTGAGTGGAAVRAVPPDVTRAPATWIAVALVVSVGLALLWMLRRRRRHDSSVVIGDAVTPAGC